MPKLTWTDIEDIALALRDKYPDQDPSFIRFTDLHKWITELDGSTTIPRNPTNPSWKRSRWRGWKNSTMTSGVLRAVAYWRRLPLCFRAAPRSRSQRARSAAAERMDHSGDAHRRGPYQRELAARRRFLSRFGFARRTRYASRGLDIAGEYIASQFRRLGLEPAGDDGYFQTVVLRPEDADSPKSRNVVGILRGSDPQLKEHIRHVELALRSCGPGAIRRRSHL